MNPSGALDLGSMTTLIHIIHYRKGKTYLSFHEIRRPLYAKATGNLRTSRTAACVAPRNFGMHEVNAATPRQLPIRLMQTQVFFLFII